MEELLPYEGLQFFLLILLICFINLVVFVCFVLKIGMFCFLIKKICMIAWWYEKKFKV